MPRKKIILFGSAAFLAAFLILYYSILHAVAKPEQIQRHTVQTIETITGGKFQYTGFRLVHFPSLRAEFETMTLEGLDPVPFQLKAGKAKFHFSFFGFLLGKAKIKHIELLGGEIHMPLPAETGRESLDVENLNVKIKTQRSFRRFQAKWEGDLERIKKSISGKMVLEINDPANFIWDETTMRADFWLKDFPLAPFQSGGDAQSGYTVKQGQVAGEFHAEKTGQNPWFRLTGDGKLLNFVYQIHDNLNTLESPALNADLNFELEANPIDEKIRLKRSLFTSPLGKLEITGNYDLPAKEIKNGRITFSELLLESIPQYYLPVREAVPFHLGFSGQSHLEMSMEGTLDHLALHGSWDLSQNLLTYSGIFEKAKEIPCSLAFDILLRNHQLLSGDFSLRLQEAGFKGTLTDLNLINGTGQLNILSNKFKLENWTALLPPFQGYQLGGELKVLANLEGNLLQRPEELKSMVNLILEKGEISKGKNRLHNIFVAADFSPISLEIKNAQIQAGDQPLKMDAIIYDPRTQPHAKINLSSDEIDLAQLLGSADHLGKKWFPETFKKRLRRFRNTIDPVLPQGQKIRKLDVQLESKGDQLTVNRLQGEAYMGEVQASGKITDLSKAPAFEIHTEINKLNLARFFSRNEDSKYLMEGNFFLKGDFQGSDLDSENWQSMLSGKGAVSITNGEFKTFSVTKTTSAISALALLADDASSGTPFDDFQSEFELKDGKIKMEKATLISRDVKAYGDGESTLSGALNYRLNAYLSWGSAKEAIGSYLGESAAQENFLGPIPLLLSGDWQRPELKTDPSKIADFTENFSKKKVQKVLRNFLPEEVLFSRPNNS